MVKSNAVKKAAKDLTKKDPKNKQKDSTQAAQDKKDQSNMLTQLKKGTRAGKPFYIAFDLEMIIQTDGLVAGLDLQ